MAPFFIPESETVNPYYGIAFALKFSQAHGKMVFRRCVISYRCKLIPDIQTKTSYGLFSRQRRGHSFGKHERGTPPVNSDMRDLRKTLTYLLTYLE